MIMSTQEVMQYLTTPDSPEMVEAKLKAIELAIRKYTNNRFYAKPVQKVQAIVRGGVFTSDSLIPFTAGDAVLVTSADKSEDYGLFTVKVVTDGSTFTVEEPVCDMDNIAVTKVSYGYDVKMGVVNLMRWEASNRDKIGISSESISRHSVTYADANGEGYLLGYPAALVGFLKPYVKARF